MNNKKFIYGSILIFSLVIFLCLFMRNNLTYATDSVVKTYYFDDLKVGDFIEPGSNMVVNYDYHTTDYFGYDSLYPGAISESVALLYYVGPDYCSDYTGNDDYYKNCESGGYLWSGMNSTVLEKGIALLDNVDVKTTEDVKILSDNMKSGGYVGWMVTNIENSKITLTAVTSESSFTLNPTDDNNYKTEASIVESSVNNYKWYKVSDLDYELNSNLGDLLKTSGNEVYFQNNLDFENDKTYEIELTFETDEDTILSFDVKSWMGGIYDKVKDRLTFYVDSEEIDVEGINGPNYFENGGFYYVLYSNALYDNYRVSLKSGSHTIKIVYDTTGDDYRKEIYNKSVSVDDFYKTYFHIKNMKLLTLINEGDTLDTSKVSNGDSIYYEAVGSNGYVLSNTVTISGLEEEEETKEDKEVVNPNTGSFMVLVFMVLVISSFALVILVRRLKDNFY